MKKRIVQLFIWLVCIGMSGDALADSVLLWNKLGSVDEIANSEIGPGFQQTSYKFADWQEAQILPAQFGNGLFINHDINEGWTNDGGNFFAVNLNDAGATPEKGTIEFWFTFKYGSNTHNHATFFLIRNALTDHFPSSNVITNAYVMAGWNGWDYGSYGKRFYTTIGNVSDSSNALALTPDYSAAPGGSLEFNDGTMFHFATVWDVNGIDGTADTLRLYVNGNMEASDTRTWTTAGGFDPYLYLGSASNYNGWDHYYNAVKGVTDNIIIRDYAKTDFSDRFQEAPVTPCISSVTVDSFQKISALEGGFGSGLESPDLFGHDVSNIGDVDGDGITDLAVGAFGDDDGGFNTGAVWILFLNADGTVKAKQKISETQGGFGGSLYTNALFGAMLDAIGDLDGDGVPDLAVGNYGDDDGGRDRGAVWIIFLNTDGTVKAEQKISSLQGGFGSGLNNSDMFGHGVANIGDLDGDGVTDLAVGAWQDDDGGANRGAVWILFLNTDGTVKAKQQISQTQGGFSGALDDSDQFGTSVSAIGDIDGDGITDLAVGAATDDDGGSDRGAVWILFMNADGTVKSEQKISSTQGGFTGALDNQDWFGWSVAKLGDLDQDGIPDLAVGAYGDDDGGSESGAIWLLFLNSNGTVKWEQKIAASTEGPFGDVLDAGDSFGSSITRIGDLNGDGVIDLAVGARTDADGGNATGAVWILFLQKEGTDSDADGIFDCDDNCPDIANPDQEDDDNDGIGNVCDNCQDVANPGQEDSNNDGIGDACDNEPPMARCKDAEAALNANGTATISASDVDNGSSDPDGDPITLALSTTSFDCSGIGTQHAVTLTVTDDEGLSDSCVANVTVVDDTAPDVQPKDITIQLDTSGNASITAADIDNGSDDNCGIASMSVTPSSFTCADAGAKTVTLTVTDSNGNVSSATATVTVEDIDSDGDEVKDCADTCPETELGSVPINANGCSAAQQGDLACPCDNDWKNHGAYVRCVTRAARIYFKGNASEIRDARKDFIVTRAQNNCGK